LTSRQGEEGEKQPNGAGRQNAKTVDQAAEKRRVAESCPSEGTLTQKEKKRAKYYPAHWGGEKRTELPEKERGAYGGRNVDANKHDWGVAERKEDREI